MAVVCILPTLCLRLLRPWASSIASALMDSLASVASAFSSIRHWFYLNRLTLATSKFKQITLLPSILSLKQHISLRLHHLFCGKFFVDSGFGDGYSSQSTLCICILFFLLMVFVSCSRIWLLQWNLCYWGHLHTNKYFHPVESVLFIQLVCYLCKNLMKTTLSLKRVTRDVVSWCSVYIR